MVYYFILLIDTDVIECLVITKFLFDYLESLFPNRKIRYGLYIVKKETFQEGFDQG